ncbi:nuclear factor related to kappa-B-binding protein [Onthophagus taurus]|uniref:nuclear factor related to kappa-B-binding protein n=1 Tax=Onthophagus taurus TaxID=166361 RepID=UPI0039BE447C
MASLKMVSLPTTTKTASVYALFWYICNAGVPQRHQFVVSAAVFFPRITGGKMNSDSSSEYTSSESTTSDSSDYERFESVQACGVRLQLPEPLCRQKEIFDKFFSSHAWNSLTDNSRQQLSRLLPTFPEDDEHEKYVTLQRLLGGDSFRFSSPLLQFHERLKAGYYRPEISKMRYMIRKAERAEAKQRYRRFREQLKNDVLESRRSLLSAVSSVPQIEPQSANVSSLYVSSISYRTKVRYFQELATIKSKMDETGFSSDDNYPDGPPIPLSRKQKRQLNSLRNSYPGNVVVSTMASKPCLDLERHVTAHYNPFLINDEMYKKLLLSHKRLKLDDVSSHEYNTKGLTIGDVINRTKLSYIKKVPPQPIKRRMEKKIKSRKKILKATPQVVRSKSPEVITKANPFFGLSSHSEIESDSDSLLERNLFKSKKLSPVLQENHFIKSPEKVSSPILNSMKSPYTPSYGKIIPATFSDLDAIGMMNLPIDFEDDCCIDILETNNRVELMQKTHTNFLSVIRDLICSTSEHRMDYNTLEERLKQWQENPISTLNDWYSSADNWIQLLKSAVDFLSGNSSELPPDFVPYIEYKSQLDMYQWIGAGRDSDTSLSSLAKYWLDHRNESKNLIHIKEEKEEIEVSDRSQTPPPPRYPTNWSVRRADPEEIRSYQEQERKRYDNPHKAFTFRCNGYESVVGPLKGIYSAGSGSTKARGHTMLSADRPNFVTILSLVRDATARLPNGEGTRADICELLKSSQYISPTAPDSVLQSVVSGALDRMHTQFDPCVKYDPKRKIWIYLHRNRSEEDFERIHQQYQNVGKAPKKINKNKTPIKEKSRNLNKIKKESTPPSLENKQKHHQKNKLNSDLTSNSELNNPGTSSAVSPGTSLLLPQLNKLAKLESNEIRTQSPTKISKQEEKEINDALQTIMQIPSPKQKSLVKIISTPTQGKSLIIPTSKSENSKTPQIIQQKLQQQPIKLELNEKSDVNKVQTKVPISVQQQILQSITGQQQIQQFKNVALIRNVSQKLNTNQTIQIQNTQQQPIQVSTPISVTRNSETGLQQIRVQQTALTPSQQQQILQSLKQKVVPVQSSVLGGQQQVVVKHKGIQKNVASGTSLLGSNRINTDNVSKSIINSNQTPLVAKVLTNAAGQVISVESLLAHQKQHGSLPQGTTVRVSGMKGSPTNIIQLAPTKQSGGVTQLVGSQNNIIAITNQPKLVFSSQAMTNTTVTTTSTTTKSNAKSLKTQTVTKFTPKIAQQLINAKFVQNVDNKSKMLLGQNQLKTTPKSITVTNKSMPTQGNTNAIRMVNAANLNLTHIGGKPVLLASKGGSLQNLQGQNVIIQSTSPQNTSSVNVINQGNTQYVLAPQIKVQQSPQVLLSSSNVKGSVQQVGQSGQSQLVLGGQQVRLQSGGTSNQRVVLASQGQSGQIVAQQILLPAGFQGTAINIKALQGVKVIPIAQAQQTAKGVQNRQVFARVMAPNIVRTVQATPETEGTAPTSE